MPLAILIAGMQEALSTWQSHIEDPTHHAEGLTGTAVGLIYEGEGDADQN